MTNLQHIKDKFNKFEELEEELGEFVYKHLKDFLDLPEKQWDYIDIKSFYTNENGIYVNTEVFFGDGDEDEHHFIPFLFI